MRRIRGLRRPQGDWRSKLFESGEYEVKGVEEVTGLRILYVEAKGSWVGY